MSDRCDSLEPHLKKDQVYTKKNVFLNEYAGSTENNVVSLLNLLWHHKFTTWKRKKVRVTPEACGA